MEPRKLDAVVVGGGPAGLASAIALAERRRSVAVVGSRPRNPALRRQEMLPVPATRLLSQLSIGHILRRKALELEAPITRWTASRPTSDEISTVGGFGWSVDRDQLEAALRQRASRLGVTLLGGRLRKITAEGQSWRLCFSANTPRPIACHFVVDASGRAAHVARRLGAGLRVGPDLVAIVGRVTNSLGRRLRVEACRDGWWYALPARSGGGTIAYLTDPSKISKGPEEAAFLADRARNTSLLPSEPNILHTSRCDARSSLLHPIVGDRWIATGDAASAFDPISSQGLINALSSGSVAGIAVADFLAGDTTSTCTYEALVGRTAARTHRETSLQYAGSRFKSRFWRSHASTSRQHSTVPSEP